MQISTSERITIEVLPWTGSINARLRRDWESLIAQHRQVPLFNYPEWMELACAAGTLHPWRILLIRQDARLVGLLVLQKRIHWTAEVCHPFTEDFPLLIIAPEAEAQTWGAVLRWLGGRESINLLSFGRWREQPRLESFTAAACAHSLFPYLRQVSPDYWLDFPNSWEAYLATLGQATRYNFRRREAQLQRDFGAENVVIEILTDSERCATALEELITLHRRRWHLQRGSYFDDPRMVDFYRNAIRWAADKGYVAMPRVRLQSQTITLMTIFHIPGQDTAYLHCVARDLDALPNKYSPGIVLYAHSIRWAIARGVRHLSMGIGTAYYKSLLGGYDCPRCELFVAHSPREARILSTLDPAIHILRNLPFEMRNRLRAFGKEKGSGEQ